MIKALAHVCIFSKDLDRSLGFYCGALGLKRHFDFIKDGKLFGFYLQAGERQFVEIFKTDATEELQAQRINHICLEVEDIDGLRAALTKHGVDVTQKKLGCDQSWQCWCKDPDGVSIEFQQYTSQSSQFTRASCTVNW